jgi:adenylate kinase
MNTSPEHLTRWLGAGSLNIFGRPFAGKDTQGRSLAELFHGSLISSGDILRHAADNTEVQAIRAAGGIIPSELFEAIVIPYLSRTEFADKPLILSEVGRAPGEEAVILRATTQAGHELKAVIVLQLEEDEVWRRFQAAQQKHDRGDRADDRREVLQTRLDAYREKVLPVIDFYREHGLLIEVDGMLAPDAVTDAILDSLTKRANTTHNL